MKKEYTGNQIKVAIADDHVLFRTGVKTALSMEKDIKMVAEADNGMQLLTLLKHIQPDVILLDIQMPIMDGITTLPEIKKLYPEVKVVMLTMHNDHSMISKLMELGANAYLTKNSDSDVIYEAVKTVHTTEYYFNALTNKALIDGLRMKRQAEAGLALDTKLTDKEVTILKLM
jgi:DNA-binding NarL/FixJ family response regulator